MSDAPAVISKVTVEIRFDRGIVFFDHCGSLMLSILDKLGNPFKGNVPTMEYGEIVSSLENLVARYGPRNVLVNQNAPDTIARFLQTAEVVWGTTAEKLALQRHVTRCGFRAYAVWPSPSKREALDRLAASGLARSSERWNDCFGRASWATHTSISRDNEREKREVLDVVSFAVEGFIPERLLLTLPNHAIQLDADYSRLVNGDENQSLGVAQLKEFVRSSWEDFKATKDRVSSVFASEGDGS